MEEMKAKLQQAKGKLVKAYNDLMAYTDWAESGEDFYNELNDTEVGKRVSMALDKLNVAHSEWKNLLNE